MVHELKATGAGNTKLRIDKRTQNHDVNDQISIKL